MTFTFEIGNHTEQAHEYTSALIDEAYRRKADDSPTKPLERVRNADRLCEAHWSIIGQMPDEGVLSRLAWYIVFDEMTDKDEHKVSREEYPILSDHQTRLRHGRESVLSDVYTGKGDETIGRHRDGEGIKRRIYDYMTPERDMSLVPTKYLDLYTALDNAGLTARQRRAIELVYFEGLTQGDAGAEMGVSQPAVAKFLRESANKLRVYYDSRL